MSKAQLEEAALWWFAWSGVLGARREEAKPGEKKRDGVKICTDNPGPSALA